MGYEGEGVGGGGSIVLSLTALIGGERVRSGGGHKKAACGWPFLPCFEATSTTQCTNLSPTLRGPYPHNDYIRRTGPHLLSARKRAQRLVLCGTDLASVKIGGKASLAVFWARDPKNDHFT